MAYLVAPLRDGLCHAYQVYFLEGISAQCTYAYLSCNDHDGRRVEHGIGHARQRIRSTRTAGHDGYAYFAADAGIALSGMYGALLVTH